VSHPLASVYLATSADMVFITSMVPVAEKDFRLDVLLISGALLTTVVVHLSMSGASLKALIAKYLDKHQYIQCLLARDGSVCDDAQTVANFKSSGGALHVVLGIDGVVIRDPMELNGRDMLERKLDSLPQLGTWSTGMAITMLLGLSRDNVHEAFRTNTRFLFEYKDFPAKLYSPDSSNCYPSARLHRSVSTPAGEIALEFKAAGVNRPISVHKLPREKWFHVAFTVEASNAGAVLKAYIDGVLCAEGIGCGPVERVKWPGMLTIGEHFEMGIGCQCSVQHFEHHEQPLSKQAVIQNMASTLTSAWESRQKHQEEEDPECAFSIGPVATRRTSRV